MKNSFMTALLILMISPVCYAMDKEKLTFALVPKEEQSGYFIKSKQGCLDAAAHLVTVTCIYRGPQKEHTRKQNQIIEALIEEGVDGIAVAVIRSGNLAEESMQKAKDAGIPIITYDADFDRSTLEKYKDIRLAYIGTNNFELGRVLGEQVKKLRPHGGKLIIQTGRPDSPNLNLRIMGVRSALSGLTYDTPPGEPLENINGWTEVRAPLPNYGNLERAVVQMEDILAGQIHEVDTFVAVAGHPQFLPDRYRQMIEPFREKLERKAVAVVVADTVDGQIDILRDGLSHVNVGQNPYEMGRQAIFTLHKIVTGQAYQPLIHTPLHVCNPDNIETCSK
jgi:ribose transport system substrate-binding protein